MTPHNQPNYGGHNYNIFRKKKNSFGGELESKQRYADLDFLSCGRDVKKVLKIKKVIPLCILNLDSYFPKIQEI